MTSAPTDPSKGKLLSETSAKDFRRDVALSVLARYGAYEWTVQGFGMVRTYLDAAKRWRLNIWDDRLQTESVSLIHDHPWSFRSFVIAGVLCNNRYRVNAIDPHTHHCAHILTGEDGGKRSDITDWRLEPFPPEIYNPGDTYAQALDEVHETSYVRGTVTLNDRTTPTEAHTARVFWPLGTRWVDAKPRAATPDEIAYAIEGVRVLRPTPSPDEEGK